VICAWDSIGTSRGRISWTVSSVALRPRHTPGLSFMLCASSVFVPPGGCAERRVMAEAVAVLLMFCAGVRAQTVTECGKSDGYSYYFAGGLVPADKGGWQKDGIDGGRIILNLINGEIDLLIKNATGSTVSIRQDGGKIFPRQTNNGLIALTVIYEVGTLTEDYVFQLDGQGDGTVVSTAIRTAGKINKMSLLMAQCRGPR
jgi:hypothetical protein